MKKIIYSDLDGTLFDYNKNGSFVSDDNIKAVQEWTENNYFGIATGRNILSVKKLFKKSVLNINLPMVLTNGATVYDFKKDKIIFKKPVPKDVIDEAVSYIYNSPIAMLLLIGPKNRFYVGKFDESICSRPSFDFTEINKDEIPYDEIVKIDFIVKAENNHELVSNIKSFKSINKASLVPSSIRYVELVNKEVSKYNGILKALEYVDIKQYRTFVIGDYLNDYEMLVNADYAFAPINALDEIKEVANYVVNSNKEHAIKDMIASIKENDL